MVVLSRRDPLILFFTGIKLILETKLKFTRLLFVSKILWWFTKFFRRNFMFIVLFLHRIILVLTICFIGICYKINKKQSKQYLDGPHTNEFIHTIVICYWSFRPRKFCMSCLTFLKNIISEDLYLTTCITHFALYLKVGHKGIKKTLIIDYFTMCWICK